MCHPVGSAAPAAPVKPVKVRKQERLMVPASDGNLVRAYGAFPSTSNGCSCIVLPDVRGLVPYYEDLTRRFAEAGFHSVAVDYYGRTRGACADDRTFNWRQHLPMVRPAHVYADVAAVARLLRRESPGPLFTVGFCFGGGHSWRLAASDLGLAGTIGFYGLPYLVEDIVDRLSSPMLLLLAGEDDETPREEFDRLIARLDMAEKDYELQVYNGAPHSFFDRSFPEWQHVCRDAWRRILRFTGCVQPDD